MRMGDAWIHKGNTPDAPTPGGQWPGAAPDVGNTPGGRAADVGKARTETVPDQYSKGALQNSRHAETPEARLVQARYGLISPFWWLMAIIMAGLPVLAFPIATYLPGPLPAGLFGLGVLLALASKWVGGCRHRLLKNRWARTTALWACVIVPTACFSTATAIWAHGGGVGWPLALGGVILVTGIGCVIQSGRRYSLLSVHLAGWTPVVLIEASPQSVGILIASLPLLMVVSQYQINLEMRALAKAEERVRKSRKAEEILREYEDTGQGWFWETDRQGRLVYTSPIITRILEQSSNFFTGMAFTDLFAHAQEREDSKRNLAFHMMTRTSFQELPVRAAVPHGREALWWSINGRPVYDGFGNFIGFRGSGHDLTERRRSQEKVVRLAHYDSLTGLFNRFQMSQTLKHILSAKTGGEHTCAVLLLDLDRFKQVNDTMGHPAGDNLLQQVAKRLQQAVPEQCQVGRLGGDEFKVIVPGHIVRSDIADLARRIIDVLSQPYLVEGQRVSIGTSVGIAIAPDDGTSTKELIRNADLALYAAKNGGRGRYYFYNSDLHFQAEERRRMELDLSDAVEHGGLKLLYQPVVHTASERVCGFEALMRWDHPQRGELGPDKFINIAEDAGLIRRLGEWAIHQACADVAMWPDDVRVAVNVSAIQFFCPDLPRIVESALASAGISADRLELEITESVFLAHDANRGAMFAALKKIGTRLALDDFGTGYSSLGYLKQAPFDSIKIDQSFVRGASHPQSPNGAIIASITSLAEALGIETTAEGVETLDELDLVRELGCSHVQGYVYDHPMTAAQAAEKLKAGPRAVTKGVQSTRAPRKTMLRKVLIQHDGEMYNGTVRNLSTTGALIDGVWNMAVGARLTIAFSGQLVVHCSVRWSEANRLGVAFDESVDLSAIGQHDGLDMDRRAAGHMWMSTEQTELPLEPARLAAKAQRRTG